MFYIIGDTGITEADRDAWEESACGIAVFDEEDWGGELKLKESFSLGRKEEDAFFFLKLFGESRCF